MLPANMLILSGWQVVGLSVIGWELQRGRRESAAKADREKANMRTVHEELAAEKQASLCLYFIVDCCINPEVGAGGWPPRSRHARALIHADTLHVGSLPWLMGTWRMPGSRQRAFRHLSIKRGNAWGTTAVSDLLCACKHSCVLVQKLESQQRDQAVMMTSIADRLERLERQLQVCKRYILGSADKDLLAQLACASMADLPSA